MARTKRLPPIRPSKGIEAAYRRELNKLIDEMSKSINSDVEALYKHKETEITRDSSLEQAFEKELNKAMVKWKKKYLARSTVLAEYFTNKCNRYTREAFRSQLTKIGLTVNLQMGDRVKKALDGVIKENVSLIKSIPVEHLSAVDKVVKESVLRGRDLEYLNKELVNRFNVTKSRAALIARDQNNKATAYISRSRNLDEGITKGRWRHTTASKVPREGHQKMDGDIYDLRKGCPEKNKNGTLTGRYIFPGEEINCGCTYEVILPFEVINE